MAGFGLKNGTFTFAASAIPHMTGYNITPSSSAITQEVADEDAALSISGAASTTVAVTFAIKTTGAATLLAALDANNQGQVVIVLKDAADATIATWTSSDSLCESQGAVVTGSAGAFTLGSCSFTTNGGAWT